MVTSLTQAHLSLLETCPRKFQHFFIDRLTVTPDPTTQASLRWGSQFHLMMQQRELDLPIDTLPVDDSEMRACMEALVTADPALFERRPDQFRQSEHARSLSFGGYLLTVVYDLLLLEPDQGQIVDWKTYLRPRSPHQLERDWQTRLYLYVLAETAPLRPEQIEMVYWFVRQRNPETGEHEPQPVRISYSVDRHRQTEQDLLRLIQRLNQWQASGADFPQVEVEQGSCDRCPFTVRCQRGEATLSDWDLSSLPALAEIEEIPLA